MDCSQSLQMSDNVIAMAENGKTRAISIRVSEEEYELLEQTAKAERRKVSDYCRNAALERAEQHTVKTSKGTQPSAA